jgi:hypothetical protein
MGEGLNWARDRARVIGREAIQAEREEAGRGGGERVYLRVPYAEKDAARVLGARWDPDLRHWWIAAGVEREPFARWPAADPGVLGAIERERRQERLRQREAVRERERRWQAAHSGPLDAEMLGILTRLRDGPVNRHGVMTNDSGTGKDTLPYAAATELLARGLIRMGGRFSHGISSDIRVEVWEITEAGLKALGEPMTQATISGAQPDKARRFRVVEDEIPF